MIFDIQKANLYKRLSAGLFDFILLSILVVLFTYMVSFFVGYDKENEKLQNYYKKYQLDYTINYKISSNEYYSASDEYREKYDLAYNALISDEQVIYVYNKLMNLTILMISFGVLFAVLLYEFIIPLILGNGQTLGKRIFGICLIRSNMIKVNHLSIFIRSILGKYTIEIMIPLYLIMMIYFNTVGVIGAIIIILLLLTNSILYFSTKNNYLIHDLLADSVVVNYNSQEIFESENELFQAKKKYALEKSKKDKE